VHSRYLRRLDDVALAGAPVEARLRVRRFFCDATACPTRTFAEQIPGLTSRHARRSLFPIENTGKAGAPLRSRF
jgi:hypothetical protein